MDADTDTSIRARWTLAGAAGVLIAAAVGAVAAWARDDAPDAVTFAVFAAVTLPPAAALAAVALDRRPHPERAADSVETQWAARASSGAFYDVVTAMGLATFVTSVLDTTALPVTLFLLLALGDVTVRLVVLQRREG